MAPPLIQQAGGQPQKQPRFAPIYISRANVGLFTNRCPLHDTSSFIVERFYGGQPDALWDGSNIEVTNRLTWQRRPGLSAFGSVTYPQSPDNAFSFHNPDGSISLFIDTPSAVYQHQGSTKTTLFTKSSGAGQTSFLQLGDALYFADGVDNMKVVNGTVWNWGIAGPAAAPNITITESGASAVAWAASTIFSTMGLLVDANGNVQQLLSVDASGTNTTQFGTTGDGEPNWNLTPGATTTDNGITWTNAGPVIPWAAETTFNDFTELGNLTDPCFCYDPTTKQIFGNTNPGTPAPGKTGSSKPSFSGIPAAITYDPTNGGHPPGVKWYCLYPVTGWKQNHAYLKWGSGNPDGTQNAVLVPNILPPPDNQTIFMMVAGNAGTSGGSGYTPVWATLAGNQTNDGDCIWVCLGSATRQTLTPYTAWGGAGQTVFSAIKDPNGNLQVCTTSGTSSSTATASITWETAYGSTTLDGNVVWTCVGTSLSWATSTKWYLPLAGFAPPQPTQPYGGAAIAETTSGTQYVQFVINSGKSGTTAPSSWGTIGATTTDSGVKWYCDAEYTQNSLAWSKGYAYCYAYKARQTDDYFITNIPNGLTVPLGPPTGSTTGGISTASPIYKMATGPNAGAVNTVSGIGSLDPQVDTICIFRCTDGYQGGPYLELTEIPNPAPIGGVAQPWNFQDYIADVDLNALITADIVGLNDPPPAGLTNIAFHSGRVWGNVGADVYCSSGNDIIVDNGNGNEGWGSANVFPLKSPVNKLVPTQSGLISFTTSDIYIITGGPAVTQFFPAIIVPGVGLLSPNALIQLGGEIYFYSADRRLLAMMPGAGDSHMGFAIADKLSATFDPASVYLTLHEQGYDNAIYLADGSAGWYRLNPHQPPDNSAIWSPYAAITGGCKMALSVETAPGVKSLLVGSGSANQPLLARDLAVWADNGTAYSAFFIVGSIVLAHPGQLAELGFLTAEFNRVGTSPTISFLLNETSGTFAQFSSYRNDPPLLYGTTLAPASLYSNRYYFKQSITIPANLTESESFNETSLSGNWTQAEGTYGIDSTTTPKSLKITSVSAIRAAMYYNNAGWTQNQTCTVTMQQLCNDEDYDSIGPAVNVSVNGGVVSYYSFYVTHTSGICYLFKQVGSTITVLATGNYLAANNSVFTITYQDGVLTGSADNNAIVLTATDNTLPPGSPGLAGFAFYNGPTDTPDTRVANWTASNLAVTNGTPPPACARHLQIRVDFPAEAYGNELYDFTIFGALWTEA